MHLAFAKAGEWEEPLWISYVDEVEIAAQEGACYSTSTLICLDTALADRVHGGAVLIP
jgi:hypothetical protein